MILESLRTARFVLIKDTIEENVLPIALNMMSHIPKDVKIAVLCYDHPATTWRTILSNLNVDYYESNDFTRNLNTKYAIFIDSFNQMSLKVGPQLSFEYLHSLLYDPTVIKLITLVHTDCMQRSSKVQAYLEHVSQLTLWSHCINDRKMRITMHSRKGGKLTKKTEDVWFDEENTCLTTQPVSSEKQIQDDMNTVLPHSLTTFKIGLENNEKTARDELDLPYMKKQSMGKVYYEHDAADDWDDEDPDEDLDI